VGGRLHPQPCSAVSRQVRAWDRAWVDSGSELLCSVHTAGVLTEAVVRQQASARDSLPPREKSWKNLSNQAESGLILDVVQKGDKGLAYSFNC
jgi:hypothetical protein